MKRKRRIVLFILLGIALQGCGTKEIRKEILKDIKSNIEQEEENILAVTKSQEDFSVTLNQIAFEEEAVILDVTMKSDDISQYGDVLPQISKDEMKINLNLGYNINGKDKKEKNDIMIFWVEKSKLSKENIGEEVEIRFSSINKLTDIDITFPVRISKVYDAETIPVGKKLEYEGKSITIESVVLSEFYTKVNISGEEDFIGDFCFLQMMDSNQKEIPAFNGSQESFLYARIKEDCEKISISMIRDKDGKNKNYETISEPMEIKLK